MDKQLLAPEPRSFEGRYVMLTPTDVQRDIHDLFSISNTTQEQRELWRYMPRGPFADVSSMAEFYTKWIATPGVISFTVREAGTKSALGSISLMNIRPEHGSAELGNIWYTPTSQRTKTNTEANYLLLKHCFDELGYRRMEWKCNALHEKSRNSALRLGYQFEGIFRKHMIVKGENRDTAWFSMIDSDWPVASKALKVWLYEDDSTSLIKLRESITTTY